MTIVRRPEHAEILKTLDAEHVVTSGTPIFMDELTEALVATGATLAFDAIGGGKLASQILSCMEAAASRGATGYSGYGSTRHKQLYVYGGLGRGPTELTLSFGMAWGIGGWLPALEYVQHGEAAAVARIPQLRDSLLATADFREGLASFMERRPARFQGK